MEHQPSERGRAARWAPAVGLLAAGAVGGAVLAGTFSASAATTADTTSASLSSYSAASGTPAPRGHGGSPPVRGDEKSLASGTAATLKAAALKAVLGGTVYRIETDAGDGTYEAHMTKADGTLVTVKFGSDLKVSRLEAGMGNGDPAPSGQPGGSSTTPGNASLGSA